MIHSCMNGTKKYNKNVNILELFLSNCFKTRVTCKEIAFVVDSKYTLIINVVIKAHKHRFRRKIIRHWEILPGCEV